ncbi:hypothetical protein FRC00_004737 [Tulasnella sp. 408]|nr:hypothetical protein FRC00_004737 [Tulasnella sp. 408]
MHDPEWDAWRLRNLEVLRNQIGEVNELSTTCTLKPYGYRLEDDPCTVVPRTCGRNILQYTIGPPELDENVKISLLLDVARAISHLHLQSPPIVHGGIHPTEILINDQGRAILFDFGLSHVVAKLESPPAYAPSARFAPFGGYYAPEISRRLPLTPAIDVFAFAGVILAVMSKLHPHFDFPYPEAAHIIRGQPRRSAHPGLPVDHPLWANMEAMWNPTPTERPLISEIVQFLESLVENGSPDPTLVHDDVMTPPSPVKTLHPQLEELLQKAFHSLRLQQCSSGRPIFASELIDRLDKENLSEFSGKLEEIHPDIAHGAFSRVSQCNWHQTLPNGSLTVVKVAVKTLIIDHLSNGGNEQQQERITKVYLLASSLLATVAEAIIQRLRRESRLWANLQHQHILPLYGFCSGPTDPYLVSPWCDRGDLSSVLEQCRDMDVVTRLTLAVQIGQGLKFLHTRVPPIAHGDIKPRNNCQPGIQPNVTVERLATELQSFGLEENPLWRVTYMLMDVLYSSLLDPFPKACAKSDITTAVLMKCKVSPAVDHALEESNRFYRIMCWCCQAYTGDRAAVTEVVTQLEAELARIQSG